MFCYKCGKEFEGKFCAYCGANNAAVVTSPVMENEKVQHAERTTVTVEKKEKIKVTPYIFLLLHGVLIFFSSNYLAEEIALSVYENDRHDFFGFSSEQVLYEYFSFSNVINTLAVILVLLLGFAVTRNLKVIVVALGSKWLGQSVLSLFSSMVRFAYAKSVGFTAEAYSEYCEIENIIYAVVSTALACVIYYFLSNGKRKSKKA